MGLFATAAPVLAAVGDPYDPAQMAADLAGGSGTVLAYVGVGVGAAIVVMLAIIGIKRGIAIYKAASK